MLQQTFGERTGLTLTIQVRYRTVSVSADAALYDGASYRAFSVYSAACKLN